MTAQTGSTFPIFTPELLAAFRIYLTRIFANPADNVARISQAGKWIAGNEPGMLRYTIARIEFEKADDDKKLLYWAAKRLTKPLWERFLLSQRQAKMKANNPRSNLKLDVEVKKRLSAYCNKHKFTINEGILELLKNSKASK